MGPYIFQSRRPSRVEPAAAGLVGWHRLYACRVHFDVDTVDSNEIVLGLGAEPGGLTSAQVQRILRDVSRSVEIVGLTIAEFIPRQVMHLQQILRTFPLLG